MDSDDSGKHQKSPSCSWLSITNVCICLDFPVLSSDKRIPHILQLILTHYGSALSAIITAGHCCSPAALLGK